MPDQFDVQRQMDHAAGQNAADAMEKLAECGDKKTERDQRLMRLDARHYFDPLNKQILCRDHEGGEFRNLGHSPVFMRQAAALVEEAAARDGYTAVSGGLFWNPTSKSLYAKSGDHYVLYSPDRRDESKGR